ncbi:MAG TPA: hypothetical protein VFU22_10920 [Roseiflexaceae bacterium]|nr:hypothetical protein [Roseiflexaceae bacterium]
MAQSAEPSAVTLESAPRPKRLDKASYTIPFRAPLSNRPRSIAPGSWAGPAAVDRRSQLGRHALEFSGADALPHGRHRGAAAGPLATPSSTDGILQFNELRISADLLESRRPSKNILFWLTAAAMPPQ